MEVRGQLKPPAALYLKKEAHYPLKRRLDGPKSRSGYCGEEKKLLALLGIEPQMSSP
jgi:hypothetical protein